MPQLGLAVHEGLCAAECPRGAAFDEVAREGERSTRKADQRDVQLAYDDSNGLEHVREVNLGLEMPKAMQVLAGAKRPVDHRPSSRHYLDPDSDSGKRHDDVGEQDRGVDTVPAHRLKCQLGRKFGLGDRVQDVAVSAHVAVFGEGSPRLAHKPHRCSLDGRAPARPEEGRIEGVHGTTVSRPSGKPHFAAPAAGFGRVFRLRSTP